MAKLLFCFSGEKQGMVWKKEKDSKNWNQRRVVLSTENNSFAYYIRPTVNLECVYGFREAFVLTVIFCLLFRTQMPKICGCLAKSMPFLQTKKLVVKIVCK